MDRYTVACLPVCFVRVLLAKYIEEHRKYTTFCVFILVDLVIVLDNKNFRSLILRMGLGFPMFADLVSN
jgi:hypothetical protein